jgi:hypothetical protein
LEAHQLQKKIIDDLKLFGFGYGELRQLWIVINTISINNKINLIEVAPRFLKEIEDNYDVILGFGPKINEKRQELADTNEQIRYNRKLLTQSPFLATSIYNLFRNGIDEIDIININKMVSELGKDLNFVKHLNNHKNKESNDNKANKWNIWKSVIFSVKEMVESENSMPEQFQNTGKMNQELDTPRFHRQDCSNCQYANYISSSLFRIIYHYIEVNRQIFSSLGYWPALPSKQEAQKPLTIFILLNSNHTKGDPEKEKGKGDNE